MSSDFERMSIPRQDGADSARLEALTRAISAIERREGTERVARSVDLGWNTVHADSAAVDALRFGGVHEWFEPEPAPGSSALYPAPPLAALAHAARSLLLTDGCDPHAKRNRPIVWVGRACWPNPTLLSGEVIARSIWVDPPEARSRFWTIDVALRCPSVLAVIADGSGLDMAGSRRLQLAAESGRTIALLARPAHERRVLSAATTRWVVSPLPSQSKSPRWTVELLRCKGVRPRTGSPSDFGRFEVEWNHAQGSLAVPPAVAGRSAAETRPEQWPGRRAG